MNITFSQEEYSDIADTLLQLVLSPALFVSYLVSLYVVDSECENMVISLYILSHL